ncbi:DUF1684 domain-containing protein [candidate division KSB1 bacterium]|nr:DUF1684 domain-containing protein [candidate division KSB1 bacterium]
MKSDIEKWKKALQEERNQKDIFFRYHPQSPIPLKQREQFKGLEYYPPDPEFRFEIPINTHTEKQVLKINDTQGSEREFLRWGEFRFKMSNELCTLQAYKHNAHEDRLFVPFRDKTSGHETYGAGRYLDLDPELNRTADEMWILDFNNAYNPWCAYSNAYACPFVAPENWLKVAIRVGEKNYSLK